MAPQIAKAASATAAVLLLSLAAAAQQPAQNPRSQPARESTSKPASTSDYLASLAAMAKEKYGDLPLPNHTLEGYGGAALTPVAHLVNPGKEGAIFGLPAVSVGGLFAGNKNAQSFAVTETLFRRVELGYALNRIGLGSLPDDIHQFTGIDIGADEVWINNFNARLLLVEENAMGLYFLPALTAGTHFKLNEGISSINDRLHGGLSRIGYDRASGTDFTLTASKTFYHPVLTLNRPLTATVGMRNTRSAQFGALGFGEDCTTTVEANVGYLLTRHLLVVYEYRQKRSPFGQIPNLIGPETSAHAVGMTYMINNHLSIQAGWAALGTVANSVENGAWWLQVKYEF